MLAYGMGLTGIVRFWLLQKVKGAFRAVVKSIRCGR